MAARQRFRFVSLAISVDRTDGVDHVFRGKPSARRDHGLSGWQPSNLTYDLPALGQDGRSARSMNSAVNSAPAKQRGIRRIHDRIGGRFGDVGWTLNLDGLLISQQQ